MTNLFSAPLFAADWLDAIQALAPLFFVIVWVISNLVGAGEKKPQPARRPQRAVPPKPAKPAAGGGEFRDEIEEFLRRNAEQKQGRRPPAAKPPLPEEPRRNRRKAGTERTVPPAPEAVPAAAAAAATAVSAATPRLGESLTQHIQERFGERERNTRALSSLRQSDAERERHLHQVFDHQLGRLAASVSDAAEAIGSGQKSAFTPAEAIGALLRDPRGMRQAIILNEILTRPADRWE